MAWHGTAGHRIAQQGTAQWCSQLTLSWRVGGGASASLPVLLPAGPRASPRPSLPRTPRPPLPAPGGGSKARAEVLGLAPQCWLPLLCELPHHRASKDLEIVPFAPKNHMSGKLHGFLLFCSFQQLISFFQGEGREGKKLDIKYLIKSQNQPLVSRHS